MRAGRLTDPRDWDVRWVTSVLALHVLIGIAGRASEQVSTAYNMLTIAAAVVVVLRTRNVIWVAAAASYVAAADVFWRMTDASVSWPTTGKYAVAGVLVLAMFRFLPDWRRLVVPALYLGMFVPGVILSFQHFGVWGSRGAIAFNVSGPLALAACVAFFSQVRMRLCEFRAVLWAIVPPVVAVATTVLIGTITAGSIRFTGESNFATSGGFRPTYVSAVLGFGVVVCVLVALTERNVHLRLVQAALAVFFLGQAVLTFSRGGVLSMVVAIGLALAVLAWAIRPPGRVAVLAGVVVAVIVGTTILVLNMVSGGKLIDRYEENTFTRRDAIARNDLDLFGEHPFLGVGIGVAPDKRPPAVEDDASHTEYSRLLAEQGLFGAVALCALAAMVVTAGWRARRGFPLAFFAAFAAWSTTEMAHSATRIALISYSFGLAMAAAGLVSDEPEAAAAVTSKQDALVP